MKTKSVGFIAGLVLFVSILLLPVPAAFQATAAKVLNGHASGLDAAQLAASMQAVLAVLALMVLWWLTEACRCRPPRCCPPCCFRC